MNHTISKEFAFSASHILSGLAEGHPCSRLHGHNYTVTLELSGPLDDVGMVVDFGALRSFGSFVDNVLDHRHLNDVMPINPTSENLAEWIAVNLRLELPQLTAVIVSETPKTTARCEL